MKIAEAVIRISLTRIPEIARRRLRDIPYGAIAAFPELRSAPFRKSKTGELPGHSWRLSAFRWRSKRRLERYALKGIGLR
ncbi:hypothetical protein ACIQWA_40640, partial [Kitasatospora sp. NPDC098652]|uniref:hypothetical protein n=1 Tax=Kitasatospora sp. NPDC098652 TaxID=3364095 RepID=UPI0038188AD8